MGRKRVWQAALMAVAFGTVAAGSCSRFLRYGPDSPMGDGYALLFLVSTALVGGPLVLTLFRVWWRRGPETWPGLALIVRMVLAGTVSAAGGFAGAVAMAAIAPVRWRIVPLFYALVTMAAVGLAVMIGAVELLAIGAWRRTDAR